MAESSDSYSLPVGLIFLFNLLLGTGVLTMPAVFAQAGYVLGILTILFLAFVSYVQTTFLIETMANANFVRRFQSTPTKECNETSTLLDEIEDSENEQLVQITESSENFRENSCLLAASATCQPVNVDYLGIESSKFAFENVAFDLDDGGDHQPGPVANFDNQLYIRLCNVKSYFNIEQKFEIGNMTEIFLNRYLSKFFFLSIIVYLFGDLLIYNSMMSKSLRDITCTANHTSANDLDSACWDTVSISRHNMYRIYLLLFISILGPLTYAKIQKTKIIQILTIILRWAAFLSMLGISLKIFIKKENRGNPPVANYIELPKLFGICVYSFMCHHSVPSIVTPISRKDRLFRAISFDYLLVMAFYLLISITGIFCFENIHDVYTLNFQKSNGEANPGSVPVFDIFLPTFPIFTLFSSYTVIALTLINNMRVLIGDMGSRLIQYSLPLVAIIPPLIIALFTEDVSSIVQYVGSYSGTLIQYVFPALLVYYSRSIVKQHFLATTFEPPTSTSNIDYFYRKLNQFASPFQANLWVYATGVWWILCIVLVTLDHLRPLFN